ncbi:putative NmrA-like family domain-containing protein 1 [Lentinula raphanica]|uniref:NmrA-like family domain-containing protein 1 n=1 Tax=Lentinula raphanica TaxID=153919 RepID=A0AA38P466_9AGAR|nr:putative NmrA-like family domain-containing protein 1 [Lentinula raphanica]
MTETSKEILVLGGTGAQGMMVVKALSRSKRYHARVLTRDPNSTWAQNLASLPNVTLMKGRQDSQEDLHRAFEGVYGAWVNIDGFSLGEKDELFYGIRAYEIARHHHVQHYIWASLPYTLRNGNWDEKYHTHADSKARIRDLILAQGQEGMKSSILTTVPYMEMLLDGVFVPRERPDGTFVWMNPATTGKFALISLEDVGYYSLWLFDNISESAGLDLTVVTDYVSFEDIARTFTKVTGKKGEHQTVTLEEYLPMAEPYPDAPVNWYAVGPNDARDMSLLSWRQNISAFWRHWNDEVNKVADMALLDRIHPNRIKSLEEWMKKLGYDGRMRTVMKGLEAGRRMKLEAQRNGKL